MKQETNNRRLIMKTNYDKLFRVLSKWYNEKQIHEIWELLKKYDKQLNK